MNCVVSSNREQITITRNQEDVSESDLLVHDETNLEQAFLLSQMFSPEFPEAMGVIYYNPDKPTYNDMMIEQIDEVIAKNEGKTLQSLVTGNNTWTVE